MDIKNARFEIKLNYNNKSLVNTNLNMIFIKTPVLCQ